MEMCSQATLITTFHSQSLKKLIQSNGKLFCVSRDIFFESQYGDLQLLSRIAGFFGNQPLEIHVGERSELFRPTQPRAPPTVSFLFLLLAGLVGYDYVSTCS